MTNNLPPQKNRPPGHLPTWAAVLTALVLIAFGALLVWYGVSQGIIERAIWAETSNYSEADYALVEGWPAVFIGSILVVLGCLPLYLAWIILSETFFGNEH